MTKMTNAMPPKIASVAVNLENGPPICHHEAECMLKSKLVAVSFGVPDFQPKRRTDGRFYDRFIQMFFKRPLIPFMISSTVTLIFLMCKYACSQGKGYFLDDFPAAAPLSTVPGLTTVDNYIPN